jgi:hypothetical protein
VESGRVSMRDTTYPWGEGEGGGGSYAFLVSKCRSHFSSPMTEIPSEPNLDLFQHMVGVDDLSNLTTKVHGFENGPFLSEISRFFVC